MKGRLLEILHGNEKPEQSKGRPLPFRLEIYLKVPIGRWFNLGGGESGLSVILKLLISNYLLTKIRWLITHFLSSRCTKYYYTGWGT